MRRLITVTSVLVFMSGCVISCTPTPAPDPALATRIAVLDNRILALEHSVQYILVPVMTLEADLALTPSATECLQPTATSMPIATASPTRQATATVPAYPTATQTVQASKPKCSRCAVYGDACNPGLVCASCGPLGYRCVDPANTHSCEQCSGSSDLGTPEASAYLPLVDPEWIDIFGLARPMRERRWDVGQ